MKLLNKEFQMYSASIAELTFGQLRSFSNFSDNESINDVSAWYDTKSDRFVINENYVDELYEFCEKAFIRSIESLQRKLPEFTLRGRREIVSIIIRIRKERLKKEIVGKEKEEIPNPNSKFISIGDDIFQISKIVSVKCRDENEKFYIEVFITNKRASVRKQFPSKTIRDFEFSKVKKILELSA